MKNNFIVFFKKTNAFFENIHQKKMSTLKANEKVTKSVSWKTTKKMTHNARFVQMVTTQKKI